MQFSLRHNIKKVGTIILGVSIPLLVFVWSYLEKVLPIKSKQELETIYLVQLIFTVTIILLALLAFIVFLIIRKKEINNIGNSKSNEKKDTNEKQSLEYQIDYSILLQILKLRGLNEIASPQNIATQIKQDTEIVFAHLKKLHNDQYVTFQTGGKPPTSDTDFFLSPKAFEIIILYPSRPKSRRRVIDPGIDHNKI
jgi:multisubunit Na+/H+ antiporter MnhC subunit